MVRAECFNSPLRFGVTSSIVTVTDDPDCRYRLPGIGSENDAPIPISHDNLAPTREAAAQRETGVPAYLLQSQ
jgi:hypothetical protein